MHKALIVPVIALAASTAIAAPTVAFAADTGSSAGSASAAAQNGTEAHSSLALSKSSAKTGDRIEITVRAGQGTHAVSVSSKALGDVTMHEGKGGIWTGAATVDRVDAGNYTVAGVVDTGGRPERPVAQLTVTADKPTPVPSASFAMSKDNGAPGEKIRFTVKNATGPVTVSSAVFGGRVKLVQDRSATGTWHGEATVAKNAGLGYYGVKAFDGTKLIDTLKFSVDEAKHGNVTPKPKPKPDPAKPTPVAPNHHKTPKGSVNTGMAPADADADDGSGPAMAIGAGAGAGAAALAGVGLLGGRRVLMTRRGNGRSNG